MAVRDHDGTGDYIDLEPGIDLTAAFTLVWGGKREANGAWHTMASWQTSADDFRVGLSFSSTDRVQIAVSTGAVDKSFNSGTGGTGTAFTVQVADGYVLVVASKPTGTGAPTLSVFKASAWSHYTYSSADFFNATTIGAGKVRIGRFEAASDDANLRGAVLSVWNGTAMNTTQVETLDGGDAVAWQSIAGGYTDLIEFAHNADGSALTAWADLGTSRNGLIDTTATAGNGTIVTGDDPGATIYTVGGSGEVWPPVDNPAAPPLRLARSGFRRR